MKRKIIIAIIVILALAVGYAIFYVNDYSHSDTTAKDFLNGTSDVNVTHVSNGIFVDGKGNDSAVIFYPGAKVEYDAYLPMLCRLAGEGVDCYLVEMPFNIAFIGSDAADDIIDNSSYDHYFIAGHSLGGVVASSYVNKTNRTDGLILFAAYPTQEIHKPVLSIYGSKDGVLNMEEYGESVPLIKGNFTEFVIEGANHAQFGNYGNQSGDNPADITAKDQQRQSVDEIVSFINRYA